MTILQPSLPNVSRSVRAIPAGGRALILRVVFALWVPSVLVPCAYLLGAHVLSLPRPAADDPRLVEAMARARGTHGQGRWVALHVLSQSCPCSRRVLRHLIDRGPRPEMVETIVLVGHDAASEAQARARGYTVESVTPEQLVALYHVEAAPLMVVADPTGAVRYRGGYTDRKQGASVRDSEVLGRLQAGEAFTPLPVLGCAVSRRLQAAVDPLGLR